MSFTKTTATAASRCTTPFGLSPTTSQGRRRKKSTNLRRICAGTLRLSSDPSALAESRLRRCYNLQRFHITTPLLHHAATPPALLLRSSTVSVRATHLFERPRPVLKWRDERRAEESGTKAPDACGSSAVSGGV